MSGELRNKKDYNVFDLTKLLKLTFALLFASIGCSIFYFVRLKITKSIFLRFLLWNLYLAWVPYILSVMMVLFAKHIKNIKLMKILMIFFGIFWLLFYPNAPYIFSDFIHLINRSSPIIRTHFLVSSKSLIWYDIIFNSAFAFLGHLLGLISIFLVHKTFSRVFIHHFGWAHICVAMYLGGFGISLGRFIRLNSWDIVFRPFHTMLEVVQYMFNLKVILFSLVFGFFIFLSYLVLYFFQNIEKNDKLS
jgi:uncharacterized membrane protein